MPSPVVADQKVMPACPDFSLLDLVSIPTFVLEKDAQDRPVYLGYNKTALQIAARQHADISGKTAIEVYPGRFGQTAYARHCIAFESGEPMTYELTLPIAGLERLIRTQLQPLIDGSGQVTHVVGTSEDISIKQDVSDLQVHATSLNAEMEQFISLAAHDLRSPMRRISGLADILRQELAGSNEEAENVLNMLENVASKSTSLIADVISHAQCTGITESIEKFSLHDLCEGLMVILDPAGEHSFTVKGIWLQGDRIATQMVLRNLLDNAVKHNEGTAISLTIEAVNLSSSEYQITVADNGRGIPEGARLFLEDGNARIDSGFGLMGIKRLINSRGGEISSESCVTGSGATFLFTLPGTVLDIAPKTAK